MKETKVIKSIAVKPEVWNKLRELSDVNGYSMSGYLEVLILERWRDLQIADSSASPTTILANGKAYEGEHSKIS